MTDDSAIPDYLELRNRLGTCFRVSRDEALEVFRCLDSGAAWFNLGGTNYNVCTLSEGTRQDLYFYFGDTDEEVEDGKPDVPPKAAIATTGVVSDKKHLKDTTKPMLSYMPFRFLGHSPAWVDISDAVSNYLEEEGKTYSAYALYEQTSGDVTIEDIARVFEHGAAKYAPRNYTESFEDPRARDIWASAILRHALAHVRGQEKDPDSGLPHMAHAAATALILCELEEFLTCQ